MNSGSSPFFDRLSQAVVEKDTVLMVGLDPRADRLPDSIAERIGGNSLQKIADGYEEFCKRVVDIVAPYVPAIKPQAAFFEQCGAAGMVALSNVVDHAKNAGLLVIMDGKRNDIGTTAEAYAQAYLGEKPVSAWGCDALTVNPYMGSDSLEPMIRQADSAGCGLFVLVKTSNAGSNTFQELIVDGAPLYRKVAEWVQGHAEQTRGSSRYGLAGSVVGATFPQHLAELRQAMPNSWFLIPGFGAQGGTAKDIEPAFDENGLGAIVNSSRQIIFAYQNGNEQEPNWEQSIERATKTAIDQLSAVVNG